MAVPYWGYPESCGVEAAATVDFLGYMWSPHFVPGTSSRALGRSHRNLGARMTEPDSAMQIRAVSEATRSKAGKAKSVIKRGKAGTPSRERPAEVGCRGEAIRQPDPGVSPATPSRDPHLMARIQQRAYVLFKACGCEHGHDLEHWLEAERQITGSPDRSDR